MVLRVNIHNCHDTVNHLHAFAFFIFAAALEQGPTWAVSLLSSLGPIIVVLGGLFGYRERLRRPQVIGLGALAVGLVLATLPAEADPANTAYTSFVLETGLAGDALDLAVALAPCTVGYGEIGARLAADPATLRGDANPYEAWIAAYAGAEYQDGVRDAVERMERLHGRHGADHRRPALEGVFREAARLEAAFWQMGLDRG